jgi:hypothetical protein
MLVDYAGPILVHLFILACILNDLSDTGIIEYTSRPPIIYTVYGKDSILHHLPKG